MNGFLQDVITGFSTYPKRLPPVYFYDAEGSRLFNEITRQPEYYLTACEKMILQEAGRELPDRIGPGLTDLIELGPGDGSKVALLLPTLSAFERILRYHPIDVSSNALEQLVRTLNRQFPQVEFYPRAAEYRQGLRQIKFAPGGRALALFLGSNIGNFSPRERDVFLRQLHESLRRDDVVLIGFDLKKDLRRLQAAYDDSAGITRRFNFNLLDRINRELGGRFNVERFTHFATYNPTVGAMESYLISLVDQDVEIEAAGGSFHFSAFEAVHVESSFKYTEAEIAELAPANGYRTLHHFTDVASDYLVALWRRL